MMSADMGKRSTEGEIMDSAMVSFAEFDECLRHIETTNKLTLGYRPVMAWLDKLRIAPSSPDRATHIIDIGSGRGEMLRQIRKWALTNKINVRLTGIDIDARATAAACKATPEGMDIHYETADLFKMDKTRIADYIVTTHFTHHLDDATLVLFIKWMENHARCGWFINDLHRHRAPYLFIKFVFSLIPVNRMARNDGPVSVARAFTAGDWRRIMRAAKIPPAQYGIRWFFPFRYGVARWKTANPSGAESGF
jgi:hypothetical protein